MSERKILCSGYDVSISCVVGGYVVGIPGGAGDFFRSPLEAWARFIEKLDLVGRRRIEAMCAKNGINPITGEREERANDE